jgi:hypothetical protein
MDFGRFFTFLILFTVGMTTWTRDQPVARPLPTHKTTQTQYKRTQTSIPSEGFEHTIPVFERAKTVHVLDGAATLIGNSRSLTQEILPYICSSKVNFHVHSSLPIGLQMRNSIKSPLSSEMTTFLHVLRGTLPLDAHTPALHNIWTSLHELTSILALNMFRVKLVLESNSAISRLRKAEKP